MASGFTYQRGKSWYYICSYTDPETGEYRREWVSPKRGGFPNTKRGAERALAARIESIEDGERPGLARTPVAEWVARWITGQAADKAATRYTYRKWLRLYIEPHIGQLRINELTQTHVREWHGKLLAGAPRTTRTPGGTTIEVSRAVSHMTVRAAHNLLSFGLHAAVADRVLRQNVAAKTPPPAPAAKRRVVLDAPQLQQLLTVADADDLWGVVIRLLALTGMRVGEVIALSWEDVDLPNSRLMVQQGVSQDEHGRAILSSPKSASSIRPVALSPSCVESLQRHRDRQQFRRRATGLVFTPGGAMLTRNRVGDALRRFCDAADVPPITPHGLRHSHATLLMAEGVPLRVVQDRLGHATPAITAALYQHPDAAMQDAAARAVDAAIIRAGEPDDSRIDSSAGM